jgi:hypothetical protein
MDKPDAAKSKAGVDEFDDVVDEMVKEFRRALVSEDGRPVDTWLQILYGAYHDRFLADNQSVWSNGNLFVPFSLSAFAIYATQSGMGETQFLALALASSALALFWLVNAENHRAFQDKSMARLLAIERVIGLTSTRAKLPDPEDTVNRVLAGRGAVKRMIRFYAFGVPLLWLLLAPSVFMR